MRRILHLSATVAMLVSGVVPRLTAQAPSRARVLPSSKVVEPREEFLATARIVARKPIGTGITHTTRVTLTNGRLTHDAHVQTVNVYKPIYRTKEFVEKDFRDSYKYNIAAYRVAKILKLDMLPPCVYREIDGQPSSVCWWVDNVQFDELTRRDKKVE